jgi:hypothetical protein
VLRRRSQIGAGRAAAAGSDLKGPQACPGLAPVSVRTQRCCTHAERASTTAHYRGYVPVVMQSHRRDVPAPQARSRRSPIGDHVRLHCRRSTRQCHRAAHAVFTIAEVQLAGVWQRLRHCIEPEQVVPHAPQLGERSRSTHRCWQRPARSPSEQVEFSTPPYRW